MATAPKTYTISGLSVELGRDRVKLGKVLAGVEPDQKKGERDLYLMKTVVDKLVDGEAIAAKTARDTADHKIKDVKSKLLEMDLMEKQGKLVPIEEAKAVVMDVMSAVRSRFLAIPTRLAKRMAGVQDPRKAKGLMDRAVHNALEEISNFNPSNLARKKPSK